MYLEETKARNKCAHEAQQQFNRLTDLNQSEEVGVNWPPARELVVRESLASKNKKTEVE
jgi:hypothetical protein